MQSKLNLFAACLATAYGLSLVDTRSALRQHTLPHTRAAATWHLAASKEDEIRELEEKLQLLKEEAKLEERSAVVGQSVQDIKLNEDAVYTELLTEQWKESDPEQIGEESIMQTAGKLLAALGLVAALALFAQVPLGQEDLSRYSALNTPTTQIDLGDLNKARSGGDV